MDGVVTDTAATHAAAWKELFDATLREHLPDAEPFDIVDDYQAYADGRTREDAVRSFLTARGMSLSDQEVVELGAKKQGYFLRELEANGAAVFPDAVALLKRTRAEGIPTALVSSSRNAETVLRAAGLLELFDVRVDGNDVVEAGIPGKPAPDPFLLAASRLGVAPGECVVLEDARSGVQAGFRAGYGLVVGVDRSDRSIEGDDIEDGLRDAGADRVLHDVTNLDLSLGWSIKGEHPDTWTLAVDGYDPQKVGQREALFGTANGYWGTRAAIPGSLADGERYPGSYAAGVYNRVVSEVHDSIAETEHTPKIPDWTFLRVRDEAGDELLPHPAAMLDTRREFDLLHGTSRQYLTVRSAGGRTTRFVVQQLNSLTGEHIAALRLTVLPVDWSGEVEVLSAINSDVENRNVDDDLQLTTRHLHTVGGELLDERTALVETRTTQSEVNIVVATRTEIADDTGTHATGHPAYGHESLHGHYFTTKVTEGERADVDKLAVAFTSRDHALSTPRLQAEWAVHRLPAYDDIMFGHAAQWADRWPAFDTVLPSGRMDQLALCSNIFHVLQTVALLTPDIDAGIPARGLLGEGYRGHIFWDEMFVYPGLTVNQPTLTNALLRYRFRRLDMSRSLAEENGWEGAVFAWQSGSSGREETPEHLYNPRMDAWIPDNSHNQRHVGLQIALSAWRYHQFTGDVDFLRDISADLIIETARAFASMARYDDATGRYHIDGVMGPDEFHDGYPTTPGSGLTDNAYTNVLVSWTMARIPDLLAELDPMDAANLRDRVGLTDEELERLDHISRNLNLAFHEDGVLSQFDGYEDLEEFDWEGYRGKYTNIGRLDLILSAENDSANNYKLSKQADTLMLFYAFSPTELDEALAHMGYELDDDSVRATIEYYLARTSDGSTLSQFVNSWALARIDLDRSFELYREAVQSDLDNRRGSSTAEGIHVGVMGGTADLIRRCYAGLEAHDGVLYLNPRLPSELGSLAFQVHMWGTPVEIHVEDNEHVAIELREVDGEPVTIQIGDERRTLHPGESWTVTL